MKFDTLFALAAVFILTVCTHSHVAAQSQPLRIFWVDVEGGAATLIVTPAGESILIDTGNPGERDPKRIHHVATRHAGAKALLGPQWTTPS